MRSSRPHRGSSPATGKQKSSLHSSSTSSTLAQNHFSTRVLDSSTRHSSNTYHHHRSDGDPGHHKLKSRRIPIRRGNGLNKTTSHKPSPKLSSLAPSQPSISENRTYIDGYTQSIINSFDNSNYHTNTRPILPQTRSHLTRSRPRLSHFDRDENNQDDALVEVNSDPHSNNHSSLNKSPLAQNSSSATTDLLQSYNNQRSTRSTSSTRSISRSQSRHNEQRLPDTFEMYKNSIQNSDSDLNSNLDKPSFPPSSSSSHHNPNHHTSSLLISMPLSFQRHENISPLSPFTPIHSTSLQNPILYTPRQSFSTYYDSGTKKNNNNNNRHSFNQNEQKPGSWEQEMAQAMIDNQRKYQSGNGDRPINGFGGINGSKITNVGGKISDRASEQINAMKDALKNFGSRLEFESSTVDPRLEHKLQRWREFGEKYREKEIHHEIEMRKKKSQIAEITHRIFSPFTEPLTINDLHGTDPDKIGTRHEYSNLQPLIFSSNEFPSFLKEDTNKFLAKTGLKRYTDMIYELYDDFVDHLNKAEPFGQRPGKRKYRLNNKLNKPYVRFSLDEMEEEMRESQSKFHDLEKDYWTQRDINERKSLELKRKARQAMGLEPDLQLEARWAQLTSEPPQKIDIPAHLGRKMMQSSQQLSEFERFRAEYKAKEDVYAEGGSKSDDEDGDAVLDPMGNNIKDDLERNAKIARVTYGPQFRPPAYTHAEALALAKEQHGGISNPPNVINMDRDLGANDTSDDDETDLELDGSMNQFDRDKIKQKHKNRKSKKSIQHFENESDSNDEGDYFDSKGNRVDAQGNPITFKRSQREQGGKRDFWLEKDGLPDLRPNDGDLSEDPYMEQQTLYQPEPPEDVQKIYKKNRAEEKKDVDELDQEYEKHIDNLTDILERQWEAQQNEDGSGIKSGWYDLKPRRLIFDDNGLLVHRDDLFGYPTQYMNAMPADEEDMDELEREHWKRRVRQANHRKYFKHGWKYEMRWGTGPKYKAADVGYIDPAQIEENAQNAEHHAQPRQYQLTHFGFQGLGAPGNDSQYGSSEIYDYIYGRPIDQMKSHGGIMSIDLFREFPPMFRTRPPDDDDWDGTTALTYDPQQNHITRWELRRQTLKFKLSMSPLGDLARWGWKMFNADVFPLTHFRYPFGWIMANVRWALGLRHALGRWSKTAAHWYIDQRFAYQANRFGEEQTQHIYHYINEYDYLKEYQLPTVLRAIREYDFDVLRSACSQHALFNILKWLHIQERFGVYFETRRNYWVESLDIRDVRKDEHNNLILDVEFAVIEPPYYYNKAGGKIFNQKSQYKWFHRPAPLIIEMTLLRDHAHPDFDYQVIDFQADARRIKRVFNNIERIYHSAQRSRTQYHNAPKFYAVRRTAQDRSYYSRRTMVVGAYHQQLEKSVFYEKELDFQEDMEDRYSEMIKYRSTFLMGPYIAALELEPIIDYMVAKTKEHPAFGLHPIKKDAAAYWAQRKELDLIKFRQREARRTRAQQNTLHRYFHKLRSLAYFKHTYDHGGDLDEFRRLHIDKLALDANHDDWFQKWYVDPERRGRPYFKNLKRFAIRAKRMLWRRGLHKFESDYMAGADHMPGQGFREQHLFNRFTKYSNRTYMRHKPGQGKRLQRRRWRRRTDKGGHNMRRRHFRKRRRFLPYMERVYVQMARGAFWESRKFFRTRNHRVNAFKGNTTHFSPKHKGPGYSVVDTTSYDRWHVWDGGYYNPDEACWTRADVFNPANQPFQPRKMYSYSFLEDNTILIPYSPYRDWDQPYRIVPQRLDEREPVQYPHFMHNMVHDDKTLPDYLEPGGHQKMGHPRFEHLPNAEVFSLNDDEQYKDYEERKGWPVPQDDKWKI